MSQGIEDLKEEILTLKARVEELEREQVMYRPAPSEWMYNCKAPKCGCEGNPAWHADKAYTDAARCKKVSRYDPVNLRRMWEKK
jgi:hypothetical protein